MPMLVISALPQGPKVDIEETLKHVCFAVAKAAELEPKHVWATWRTIEPGWYVEGGESAREQRHSTHPPIVDLIAFEGRSPEKIERMLTAAAETLTSRLGIERGNAFVNWTEARSGRVYTGGEVVKAKVR